MSAIVRPILIGLAACLAAGPALAQSAPRPQPGQAAGLRYLTWSGKRPDPARTPAPAPVAAQPGAEPAAALRPRIYGPPAAPRPNSLTPASAWLPSTPAATPSPPSTEPSAETAAPQAASSPAPSGVEVLAAAVSADPMAPRADAPIHRIAHEPQPTAGGESPRYYSVHRAAGHTPDPVAIPDPVYLDRAPVDLAEPAGPPVVMRDARGRLIPAEPQDGSTLP